MQLIGPVVFTALVVAFGGFMAIPIYDFSYAKEIGQGIVLGTAAFSLIFLFLMEFLPARPLTYEPRIRIWHIALGCSLLLPSLVIFNAEMPLETKELVSICALGVSPWIHYFVCMSFIKGYWGY